MSQETSKQGSTRIKIRPTEDGLHLDGSILWLDSHSNGELSFLSSATMTQNSNVPQVITTEETMKILELRKRKPKALVCQYNRPFSIGKLRIELLPSGSVLGGASLYVESDKGRILYAPALQTQKIAAIRQMQLKKAQTLILGAHQPYSTQNQPNRKKEKERLLARVRELLADNQYPIIMCNAIATASDLTRLLTENSIQVACHSTVYKINKIYEHYGTSLGEFKNFNPKRHKDFVVIFPREERSMRRHPSLFNRPPILIEDTYMEATDEGQDAANRFFISSTCDSRELKEVVTAVGPKEVYVFGPYAKAYAEELKQVCKNTKPLFSNDQPTLF